MEKKDLMIGAFLAGWVYRFSHNMYLGALGEVIGTGVIGSVVSALIIAPMLMGKSMAVGALVVAFSGSTLLGSVIGILGLKLLERAGFADLRAKP